MLALSISTAHGSQRLDPQAVEKATFSGKLPAGDHTSPLLIKVEVLLDRLHFSPGEIDGKLGENVTKALAAYSDAHGLPTGAPLTQDIVSSLSADTRPILTQYVLTENDLKGPFTKHIPAKMEEMKGMKRVGYRNAKEAIAEKFHVTEQLSYRVPLMGSDSRVARRSPRVKLPGYFPALDGSTKKFVMCRARIPKNEGVQPLWIEFVPHSQRLRAINPAIGSSMKRFAFRSVVSLGVTLSGE